MADAQQALDSGATPEEAIGPWRQPIGYFFVELAANAEQESTPVHEIGRLRTVFTDW